LLDAFNEAGARGEFRAADGAVRVPDGLRNCLEILGEKVNILIFIDKIIDMRKKTDGNATRAI
jgi:hypothetical protein